ncbi:MAG: DUF4846 domain-containing protein [Armatimonadota bacterium]|nr:DUF4846 domain-containing protein [Armatimonadota bacterium]
MRWGKALFVAVAVILGCRDSRHADRDAVPHPPAEVYVSPMPRDAYPWPCRFEEYREPIAARFPAPRGFERAEVADGSWGQWLRHLPMAPTGTPVRGEDGDVIARSDAPHVAGVVDMDVRENQECADVILRLRAEYLRWAGREEEIKFALTGGGTISWPQWRRGTRPRLEGDELAFERTAEPDDSRASFDAFLSAVFAWCGTISLTRDGEPVTLGELAVGDYLAHGGSPGHAAVIVDLARDESGQTVGLVLQGFMPAQTPHLVAGDRGAWHTLSPSRPVEVPWGRFVRPEVSGMI